MTGELYCTLCAMRLITFAEEQRAALDKHGPDVICDDCRAELKPLYKSIETAERERDRARALLKTLQWVEGWCPSCGLHRTSGHAPGCAIKAELDEMEATNAPEDS